MAVLVSCIALLIVSETLAEDPETVLFSGVSRAGDLPGGQRARHPVREHRARREPIDFEHPDSAGRRRAASPNWPGRPARPAFFLFLYLEVLDASFSFDGVIGAFAITSDPIIIALGLGLIGAMFVRSLTVFLVRKGTLSEYVYLEHGAHWAIGALAFILMISIGVHISEFITGLLGVAFIGASFLTSIRRNRGLAAKGEEVGTVNA